MNLRAIRTKGLELGLIRPDQELSDEDVMQLVLEPGFSTAGTLTQQAGRGVGMDVVAVEIKKLGGALHMESTPGRGSRFTIRLPFTLAISHALVVRTGDEYYALPLPTVEGVVRVPRAEVEVHLRADGPSFAHGGQKYRLQPLASYVGMEASPLPEQDVTIPIVLVRAGEHSTGLVADELIGSREIVVKPVARRSRAFAAFPAPPSSAMGASSSFSTSVRWCAPSGAGAPRQPSRATRPIGARSRSWSMTRSRYGA